MTAEMEDFVVGGFLTEAFAKKGWFLRFMSNIANGKHDIGVDNANVLVLDRQSGQLIDEKIPVYIRMGIRMVYRSRLGSLRKSLDSKMARAFLSSQSIKQGQKFDDPTSVAYIKSIVMSLVFFHLKKKQQRQTRFY